MERGSIVLVVYLFFNFFTAGLVCRDRVCGLHAWETCDTTTCATLFLEGPSTIQKKAPAVQRMTKLPYSKGVWFLESLLSFLFGGLWSASSKGISCVMVELM
jgi:hypothetical protein